MGHGVRAKNQRATINKIMTELKDDEAMIVVDFKMKFESFHFREKTQISMEKRAYLGMEV